VGGDQVLAVDAAWSLIRQTGLDRGRIAEERRAQAELLRGLSNPFREHRSWR
jgi:hypothetical protein